MALKIVGNGGVQIRTAADTGPEFKAAILRAKKGINDSFYQIIKMVESAPNALKNDPAFDEMDRAYKMFDAALKKLEMKATGTAGHWTGR